MSADSKPYLSVVATARNDNHGGNLLGRMQLFVDGLLKQCDRHELDAELVLVDWNPPAEKPHLSEALNWPQKPGRCQVRVVEVPPEVHARFQHSEGLPLFQMIAKNVGVRRARGDYVMATNIDILFSDEVFEFLKSDRLKPGFLYRVNRFDVPETVPADQPFEEQLRFCQENVIRKHFFEGSFDCRSGKWTSRRDYVNTLRGRINKVLRLTRYHIRRIWGTFKNNALNFYRKHWWTIRNNTINRTRHAWNRYIMGTIRRVAHQARLYGRHYRNVFLYNSRKLVGLFMRPARRTYRSTIRSFREDYQGFWESREGENRPENSAWCTLVSGLRKTAWRVMRALWRMSGKAVSLALKPLKILPGYESLEQSWHRMTLSYLVTAVIVASCNVGTQIVLRSRYFLLVVQESLPRWMDPSVLLCAEVNGESREDLKRELQDQLGRMRAVPIGEQIQRHAIQRERAHVRRELLKGRQKKRSKQLELLRQEERERQREEQLLLQAEEKERKEREAEERERRASMEPDQEFAHDSPSQEEGSPDQEEDSPGREKDSPEQEQTVEQAEPPAAKEAKEKKYGPTRQPHVPGFWELCALLLTGHYPNVPLAWPSLHTNGCGDFTMLHRDDWDALQGYAEFEMYSMHIDSLFLLCVSHHGLKQYTLSKRAPIYHIEHGIGSGWTPEGEDKLKKRLEKAKVPQLSHDEFMYYDRNMAITGKAEYFNDDNWGLADVTLPETTIS